MSLVHFSYDPFIDFNRFFDDALFAHLTPTRVARDTHLDSFRPRMDLRESKESNTATATFELPGLKSEDVTIDVHQNRLTISGELNRSRSESQEEEGYARALRERHYGTFSRTLQLPFGTKPEDVKAKMENGLLTVTFPKTTPEQLAKRVPVL